MGNAAAQSGAGAGGQQPDVRLMLSQDLPKLIFVDNLGDGKFMKSYRCKIDGVTVVVKVYVRQNPAEDLQSAEQALAHIAEALPPYKNPNVLPYRSWLLAPGRAVPGKGGSRGAAAAGTPAYLLRQYVLSNLQDRLSTRPFLSPVEKKWVAYQLFRAVESCHAGGVCHGDIKAENALVTSWNWVLLADFAPFKPTYLPDDQTADVNYYFRARERRRCYLAPERFYSTHHQARPAGTGGAGAVADEAAAGTAAAAAAGDASGKPRKRPSITQDTSAATSAAASPRSSNADGAGVGAESSPLAEFFAAGAATTRSPSSAATAAADRRALPMHGSPKPPPPLSGGAAAAAAASASAPPAAAPGGKTGQLSEAMDVFSLGCVVAEVFLDGEPLFDLPMLLQYRAAATDAEAARSLKALGRLEDPAARGLLQHMLRRDPQRRKSAAEYLAGMERPGALFPPSFRRLLHPLMAEAHAAARTPDERLAVVCRGYGRAMRELAGVDDPEGEAFFRNCADEIAGPLAADGNPDLGWVAAADSLPATTALAQERSSAAAAAAAAAPAELAGVVGAMRSTEEDVAALLEQTQALIDRVEARARRRQNWQAGGGGSEEENAAAGASSAGTAVAVPAAAAAAAAAVLVPHTTPSPPTSSSSAARSTPLSSRNDVPSTTGFLGAAVTGVAGPNSSSSSAGADASASSSSSPNAPSLPPLPLSGTEDRCAIENGLIIVVQLVCSCLRHLRRPQSRLVALRLLLRMGRHCDEEARLQRLAPYVLTALDDPVAAVRAAAVRCLVALLAAVSTFPPSDADAFQLYFFPALQRLPADPEEVVRLAFAESLASLAETALRFLDATHAMRLQGILTPGPPPAPTAAGGPAGGAAAGAGAAAAAAGAATASRSERRSSLSRTNAAAGSNTSAGKARLLEGSYDKELALLRAKVGRWFVILASSDATGSGGGGGGSSGPMGSGSGSGSGLAVVGAVSTVKRALLQDVARLCVFFGHESTLNSVLPQLIAFLNDRDWEVRAAFCRHIPAVCAFVGKVGTAKFILPCVENALVDVEEAVIAAALRCLAALVSLALIPPHTLLQQLKDTAPLLCHPGRAVRAAAVALAASAGAALPAVDAWVFLMPLLRPYLRYGLMASEVSAGEVTEALRPPVSRAAFREAVLDLCEERLARRGGGAAAAAAAAEEAAAAAAAASAGSFAMPNGYHGGLDYDGLPLTHAAAQNGVGSGSGSRNRQQQHSGGARSMDVHSGGVFGSEEEAMEWRLDVNGSAVDVLPESSNRGRARSPRRQISAVAERSAVPPLTQESGSSSSSRPRPRSLSAGVVASRLLESEVLLTASRTPPARAAPLGDSSGGGASGTESWATAASSLRGAEHARVSNNAAVPQPLVLEEGTAAAAAAGIAAAASAEARASAMEAAGGAAAAAALTPRSAAAAEAAAVAEQLALEESDKLGLMRGYLEVAAQHLANNPGRMAAWERGSVTGARVGRMGASALAAHAMAASMRHYGLKLPEALAQSLYVPNQRLAAFRPPRGRRFASSRLIAAGGDAAGGGYQEGAAAQSTNAVVEDGFFSRKGLDDPAFWRDPALLAELTGLKVRPWATEDAEVVEGARQTALAAAAIAAAAAAARSSAAAAAAAAASSNASGANGGNGSPMGLAGAQAGPLTTAAATAAAAAAVAATAAAESAAAEAVASYWDARSADPVLEPLCLLRRAQALRIPPLPPDMGPPLWPEGGGGGGPAGSGGGVGGGAGGAAAVLAAGAAVGMGIPGTNERRSNWRPRHDCALVATLAGHSGAVNRLAVSPDHSFLVTASSDGSCRVWELRNMEHNVAPTSCVTYSSQTGPILDACMCEDSHSVASASKEGTIHVWRVDLAPSSGRSAGGSGNVTEASAENGYYYANGGDGPAALSDGAGGAATANGGVGSAGRFSVGAWRVRDAAQVRVVAPGEGACLTVQHYNTDAASLLVYATEAGAVHALDLRARREPWVLRCLPELGVLTAVSPGVASDRSWLCVGTSRGYLALWDVRFPVMAKLWRHSSGGPLHRIAACNSLPQDHHRSGGGAAADGYGFGRANPTLPRSPHVFLAAGRNEVAVWDLSRGGTCRQCFRVVAPGDAAAATAPPPSLTPVALPRHPKAPVLSLAEQIAVARAPPPLAGESVRAVHGKVSREDQSYLITAGTDRCIRSWDFLQPSRCYLLAGRGPTQPQPTAEFLAVRPARSSSAGGSAGHAAGQQEQAATLCLFRERPASEAGFAPSSQSPILSERGLLGAKSAHDDCILDLKMFETPSRMLLSASRDGVVKVWR